MTNLHSQGIHGPADAPPSYEATQLSYQIATIRTVTMQQHSPGPTIGPHLIRSGELLSEQADLISITSHTSYDDMLKLLHARFQARSGIEAPSKTMSFYCRIAIIYDGIRILLNNDSWPLAKSLLLSTTNECRTRPPARSADLIFMFAAKPKDEVRSKGRRFPALFAKEEGSSTCLIELLL